jgi:hypothetical protein
VFGIVGFEFFHRALSRYTYTKSMSAARQRPPSRRRCQENRMQPGLELNRFS